MKRKDKNKDYDLTKMREEELRIDSQRTNMNNANPYSQYPNYGYIPVEQSQTQIESRLTQTELHVPRHSKERNNSQSNDRTSKKASKRVSNVDPEIVKEKRIRTFKIVHRSVLIIIILALLTFLVLGILQLVK